MPRDNLPSKCFRLRPPATNWVLRGERDEDDLRQDDNDLSDNEDCEEGDGGEDCEEHALFVHISCRATLNDATIDLLAARLARDADRQGQRMQFVTQIHRLIDARALHAWGRLACTGKNFRIRAKETEHASFRDRGRDASYVMVSSINVQMYSHQLLIQHSLIGAPLGPLMSKGSVK